jgi:hypothetical protein
VPVLVAERDVLDVLRVSEDAGVLGRLGPQCESHSEMLRARLVASAEAGSGHGRRGP